MKDDVELSNMFESISIVTTQIDVCPSKASDGIWTSKINKEESKQVKSSKGISEHTNSYSMKLERSIINRNSYVRIGKEQKSYIIECYQSQRRAYLKWRKKLVLEYSTVYSIIKEYRIRRCLVPPKNYRHFAKLGGGLDKGDFYFH